MLAKAKSDYDKDILGLKNKNADLITRESEAKSNLETYKVEAEKEKHETAKALAEKNGSIEDYKVALQNEKDAMVNLEATFQQERDNRVLGDAVSDFSGVIADDPAAKQYMQAQFSSLVEVKDGQVVPKDTTKTIDDLKQSLRQLIIDIRVKDNARGIYDDYTAMANVMLLVMLSPEFVIQR